MRTLRALLQNILSCALIVGNLQAGAQSQSTSSADPIRQADSAFRAGFAARQAGNL